MQPLTAKELEYIVDSMSNEELLAKQCTATAAQTQNRQAQQMCQQLANRHMRHFDHLMQVLQQHAGSAPTSPQ